MKYTFTIIVTVVILILVLMPGSSIPDSSIPAIDKLVHFLLFTGWTVAVIHDFDTKWYKALIAGLLFALLTEVIQIPIENRTFDVKDLVADGAGVLFGIANATWIIRLTKRVLRR